MRNFILIRAFCHPTKMINYCREKQVISELRLIKTLPRVGIYRGGPCAGKLRTGRGFSRRRRMLRPRDPACTAADNAPPSPPRDIKRGGGGEGGRGEERWPGEGAVRGEGRRSETRLGERRPVGRMGWGGKRTRLVGAARGTRKKVAWPGVVGEGELTDHAWSAVNLSPNRFCRVLPASIVGDTGLGKNSRHRCAFKKIHLQPLRDNARILKTEREREREKEREREIR